MADNQLSSDLWEPSPPQLQAIEMMAHAVDQTATAKALGVVRTTVARWWTFPPFRDRVRARQLELAAEYNGDFCILVAMALQIEMEALSGGILASSLRARLAHDILSRTAYRVAVATALVDRRNNGPSGERDPGAAIAQLREAAGDI